MPYWDVLGRTNKLFHSERKIKQSKNRKGETWNILWSWNDETNYTGQQKNTFFQNALEICTYSGAEWCRKHEVAFIFSLK